MLLLPAEVSQEGELDLGLVVGEFGLKELSSVSFWMCGLREAAAVVECQIEVVLRGGWERRRHTS
jgi:hypothetical protein